MAKSFLGKCLLSAIVIKTATGCVKGFHRPTGLLQRDTVPVQGQLKWHWEGWLEWEMG